MSSSGSWLTEIARCCAGFTKFSRHFQTKTLSLHGSRNLKPSPITIGWVAFFWVQTNPHSLIALLCPGTNWKNNLRLNDTHIEPPFSVGAGRLLGRSPPPLIRERPTSLPPDEPTTPRRHRVEVRKAAAQAERQAVKITPMAVTRSKSIFGGKMLGGKKLRKVGSSYCGCGCWIFWCHVICVVFFSLRLLNTVFVVSFLKVLGISYTINYLRPFDFDLSQAQDKRVLW